MNSSENLFWLARDKSGYLHLFVKKPRKEELCFLCSGVNNMLNLPKSMFPEVTFENSPIQVKLDLTDSSQTIIQKY